MELKKTILIGIFVGLIVLSLVGTVAGEAYVIDGNVYFLPLYSEGRDTDITCSNDTFNTSTTANTTGYYIFENLAAGFYWINATLHSYIDNNALVEVVSGYNQTLLSGCDAL